MDIYIERERDRYSYRYRYRYKYRSITLFINMFIYIFIYLYLYLYRQHLTQEKNIVIISVYTEECITVLYHLQNMKAFVQKIEVM